MNKHRFYFLDNLRAFAILLVIILHASMSYMAYAPKWWYVVDTQQSIIFTKMVLLIDVPVMLVMFFLAGYFACPSLAKKGAPLFCKDKFIRVGVPWIIGVLLLAAPTTYMIFYSRHIPVSFWQFLQHHFWHEMYQQSVYWFLGILLLFFLVFCLISVFHPKLLAQKSDITQPRWSLFVLFAVLMTLGFWVMNQFFSLGSWYNRGYIFMFQPVRAPLYIGYFLLGIYAFHHGWLTDKGYIPRLIPWLICCLASGYLYLQYRLYIPAPTQTTSLLKAGNAILFNSFCLSALMASIAIFRLIVNSNHLFFKALADNSYGMYFIHPLILYPLVYIAKPVTAALIVKSASVVLLTCLLSWLCSNYLLKKAPLIRRCF